MMNKSILFVSIILFFSFQTKAQMQTTDNFNTWFMYFGSHKFTKRWGIHAEAQVRQNEFLKRPQHLLLRTGINHHLNPNIVLTAGYCFVETHPYGEFAVKSNFSEHRFWEQIQYKTQWSKMEWISRMRLEQRFSQLPIQSGESFEAGDAIYTNRVRILNRFFIPLKGDKIADKSLYLSIYDEFMINFGENLTKNIFDQNRAYIALGYKLPKVGHVEFGYLNQLVLRPNGYKQEINHNLQFSLNSTLGF